MKIFTSVYIFIYISVCFNPYIAIINLETDLQPYFLILSVPLLMSFNLKVNRIILLLFIPLIFSCFLLIFSHSIFTGLRSISGFLNLFITTTIFFQLLKKYNILFILSLKFSIYIWGLIGLIQYFINREFGTILLSRVSTDESRGVTSLAPEPTFYGLVCLFLILIISNVNFNNKNIYIFLLLIQIVFLASSSMTIILLFFYMFYFVIFKFNLRYILYSLFIGASFISILFYSTIDASSFGRVYNIYQMIIENPISIFSLDASANDRLSSIYVSIYGFFDNMFLPHPYGSYDSYQKNILRGNTFFWWTQDRSRIQSFYGSILFNIGFIGLFIPFVISKLLYKTHNRRDYLVNFFFINTILFTAIPVSFPFVAIYIATLLYKNITTQYR